MKIPNKLTDFLKSKEQYIQFIKNNKNCCSTYYQGDDMFVLKNGYIFYWEMGLEENYFKWKVKI